jgi:hypothetical protein
MLAGGPVIVAGEKPRPLTEQAKKSIYLIIKVFHKLFDV